MNFVQANMGVATGWGGGRRLAEIVGKRETLKLLLSCQKIGLEQASALGLCDAVVPGKSNATPFNESLQ